MFLQDVILCCSRMVRQLAHFATWLTQSLDTTRLLSLDVPVRHTTLEPRSQRSQSMAWRSASTQRRVSCSGIQDQLYSKRAATESTSWTIRTGVDPISPKLGPNLGTAPACLWRRGCA